VVVEITLLLAAGQNWQQEIDRLSDQVEAAVMGIGEVVGYDYSLEANEVTLLVGGEDADRLVSLALPMVHAMKPLRGSSYTVTDAPH
jgi:hypothetical protein